ncbi:molecular chaperone [Thermodesulfobacteriota bacterium]
MIEQQTSILKGLANICSLFWGPEKRICQELLEGHYLRSLTELEDVNADLKDYLEKVQNLLGKYPDSSALFEDLEIQYVRLFISRRGGIKTPLYQSCYISENAPLMGEPARIMTEKLRAAGLNLDATLNEPPDHIAIQGEYLYFLLEKGWKDSDVQKLNEAGDFARETMLPWVEILRERLEEDEEGRFYEIITGMFCYLLQVIIEHTLPLSNP